MENLSKWTNDILSGKSRRKVIPIMTHPGIEFIGATVKQAVTDGNTHFAAIRAVNNSFNLDAVTVIMDLTVEAEAFGADIIFPEDEIPSVVGRLLDDEDAIDGLKVPELTSGRVPEYLLANRLAVQAYKDKPVFAGCIGPYSLAGRLYDMSEFMMLCYSDEEPAKKLLQLCTDFLILYCRELKRIGVDGIVIAEPAAGLLSNDGCAEFSSTYIKQIVDELQDKTFIVILHNCGNTGHCTEAMLESGAKAYHFGNKANMVEVLGMCPADVLVMGNVDPVGAFKAGTPEQMRETVANLLAETSSYNNFILSSGCDVPPHVSKANIDAFINTLERYNS